MKLRKHQPLEEEGAFWMSCTRHEMIHQRNTYEKARTQPRQLQSFSTCITKQTVFCCLSAEYCVTVFFTDVGNVFKLVIFFKCFLFCYGLFRFRKCWKLFSRRLPVIYTVLFKQYLEEPKVSDNGWLVRFRNSWSNCSLCEESKKRSKQVFYPPETGLTGCLYSSLFSWVHPVQNTGKVLFSEKEKRCIIYKSRFVLLNSSFVFWLAIRTRQSMARLVKIYRDTTN